LHEHYERSKIDSATPLDPSPEQKPPIDRKQYNRIIWVLGSLCAIGPFSIDMYLPGFPAMAADLATDIAHVGLSLTSYFVGIAIGQIAYGPLMDRFGRKKPLMLGLWVFIAAALGCAFARSISTLIVLRFFLALGGCVGMAGSRTVVRDLFSGIEVARVLSALVMVFGVSPIIAPTIGGLVVKGFGWRFIFIILAAIGAAVLVALVRLLKESRGADTSISLHPKSIILDYMGLFREPAFVVYTFAGAAAVAGFFAYISGSSLVYMELLGFSETQFGWMYGINAIGLIGGSQINRLWLKRQDSAGILLRVSAAQFLIIVALLVLPLHGVLGRFGLMSLLFGYLFFYGFVNANSMALALMPFTRNVGSASALMGSIQVVAGALTSWLVSSLHDGTALPMIRVMAGCAVISVVMLWGFVLPRRFTLAHPRGGRGPGA